MKSSSFNTVTTFSKITAALLFIILPMITLFIGMEYQKKIMMTYYQINQPKQSACPSPVKTNNDVWFNPYLHARGKYTINYPSDWTLYDHEHELGEPIEVISSISIKNEQSKYNTFISVKVDRDTFANYKSKFHVRGDIKETKKYVFHDAVGTREVIDEGNFDVISYLLERKGLIYDVNLNVLKNDPNKKEEFETLEKIFSTLEFSDHLIDNCKQ